MNAKSKTFTREEGERKRERERAKERERERERERFIKNILNMCARIYIVIIILCFVYNRHLFTIRLIALYTTFPHTNILYI